MTKEQYGRIERYMRSCMDDAAHDVEHIYRVLYGALDIASKERGVDYDILIAACLLHDIARREQFEDPTRDHAVVGGDKAYAFLIGEGFGEDFAERVKACIVTHRFRKSNPPQSLEAKILFDADKLDVVGAMGVARTLVYKGTVNDPLYTIGDDGLPSDGVGDSRPSFMQEYKFKLEKLYDRFYTERGEAVAQSRRQAAVVFYESLLGEARGTYAHGRDILGDIIK